MSYEENINKFLEFKDAFELFDKTGQGLIKYNECANFARCFGYNPAEYTVQGEFALFLNFLKDFLQIIFYLTR